MRRRTLADQNSPTGWDAHVAVPRLLPAQDCSASVCHCADVPGERKTRRLGWALHVPLGPKNASIEAGQVETICNAFAAAGVPQVAGGLRPSGNSSPTSATILVERGSRSSYRESQRPED